MHSEDQLTATVRNDAEHRRFLLVGLGRPDWRAGQRSSAVRQDAIYRPYIVGELLSGCDLNVSDVQLGESDR